MIPNSIIKWRDRNIRDINNLHIKDNNTSVVGHTNSWTESKIEDIQDQDHLILRIIHRSINIKSIFLLNIKINRKDINSIDQNNRSHHIS